MLVTGESAVTHSFGGFEFRSLAVPSRGSTEIALWTVDVPEGGDGTPHRASKEEVFYVLSGSVTIQGQTAGTGDAVVVPPDTELSLTGGPARVLVATSVGIRGTLADGRTITPPWSL
ncbi:cupin domain-containing protein [Lentzea jiangxiensis]|uniref:Cupin domain-containing protein n=1 Tax=Lentzea jiangxiensis TaxID=641025 RepID=A0A1H0VCV3_9PSEU|nr:cupin domain-containing protein [Lentzea jiangxiensis]SDP76362.1 Cupin domain-containing protein [Lentzea jiangxiensis]